MGIAAVTESVLHNVVMGSVTSMLNAHWLTTEAVNQSEAGPGPTKGLGLSIAGLRNGQTEVAKVR